MDNYQNIAAALDDDGLMMYNAYTEKYLIGNTEDYQKSMINPQPISTGSVVETPFRLATNWKDAYPEIDGRTAVLATLFNQGERKPPHPNPVPNDFGKQAKKEYYYMRQLLGLDKRRELA